jgi:diguanylate cyclase (GGDEF)-like protein/PAS domain S-box-containing protein
MRDDADKFAALGSLAHASDIRALRDFAELGGEWFWEQDKEFRFTSFFGVLAEKLRRNQDDFLGKRRWEMPIRGVTLEQLAEHIATYERHEPFRNFTYDVVGEGGEPQYYSVSGTPIYDDRGEFCGYHGIGRNITELRLAELEIERGKHKLAQILHGSPVATFVVDAEYRITQWNQSCAKLTGLSEAAVLGGTPAWCVFYPEPHALLADLIVAETPIAEIRARYPSIHQSAMIDGAIETEAFFPNMGEHGRWLHQTATPLRDSEGKVIGAIETLQDITLQRNARAELERLASRDGLTGLANRRFFDKTLDTEWKRARREAHWLTLMMIDVDHFKRYNDTYGHPAGDLALKQVARALEQVVHRPGDLVARYGGEEFVVVIPATRNEGAEVVAGRILERIRDLAIPHSGGDGGRLTLSIGISTLMPDEKSSPESLVSAADAALYRAKRSGRNRLCRAP